MYNQFENARVTCDWACHVAHHNSDLGTDYHFGVGTPILAPFAGTVTNQIRQESPVLYITRIQSDARPNVTAEFMHLSKFVAPGHFSEQAVIGYSGGALGQVGSGHATGPHIHANGVVDGRLVPYDSLFSMFAGSGPVTPIPEGNPMSMRLLGPYGTVPNQTYVLETDWGQYGPLNQTPQADMVYRYLTTTAPVQADIDGVAALLAAAPTMHAFYSPAGGGSGFTSADRVVLDSLPTSAQLGTALTSNASLVNGHTDSAVATLKVARTIPAIP